MQGDEIAKLRAALKAQTLLTKNLLELLVMNGAIDRTSAYAIASGPAHDVSDPELQAAWTEVANTLLPRGHSHTQ